MDQESVERIRSATFNLARRGYDRREVDTFLQRLADWLEAGSEDESPSEFQERELERIAQRTAKVLTSAGEAAAAIVADAEAEVAAKLDEARIAANAARIEADQTREQVRGEVDEYAQAERGKAAAYAHELRRDVDDYDRRTRAEADAYAGQTREEAEALVVEVREEAEAEAKRLTDEAKREAARLLDEARRERKDVETVIADLSERRDRLLDELERIAGAIAGTASEHRRPEPPTETLIDGSEGRSGDRSEGAEARPETPAPKG